MAYNSAVYYPMGYDHRNMPVSMHGGAYEVPMDYYFPQSASSISSRSRNPTNVNQSFPLNLKCNMFSFNQYEQEINTFLRHTTTSSSYQTNDQSIKSHRSHRQHRDNTEYHHKFSSRHRSKSREHRR